MATIRTTPLAHSARGAYMAQCFSCAWRRVERNQFAAEDAANTHAFFTTHATNTVALPAQGAGSVGSEVTNG